MTGSTYTDEGGSAVPDPRKTTSRDKRWTIARWLSLGGAILAASGSAALRLARLFNKWRAHRQACAELLSLDDDQLKAAGISKQSLMEAVHKPFWRM